MTRWAKASPTPWPWDLVVKKGMKIPAPLAITDRICRRYLIDLVRIGGEGGPRNPKDVIAQELTLTVTETTAKEIWDEANAKLASLPVHRILESNRVAVVCTTDDPTDSLEQHRRIRKSGRPCRCKFKCRPIPPRRPRSRRREDSA